MSKRHVQKIFELSNGEKNFSSVMIMSDLVRFRKILEQRGRKARCTKRERITQRYYNERWDIFYFSFCSATFNVL